ncbi:MAG: glutaredoxin 3 [Planctomycetes bacterium]|nr:glutaredoxin 3 [Planctomycetota bacterium]
MTERTERVVVYRTSLCPFCVAAEQLLDALGIPAQQIYLDDHPDRRGFTSSILPGHRTVPLVIIDDRAIGGYQELRALAERGELAGLS